MGYEIKLTTKENIWYAEVRKPLSADSFMPYKLEAPSQTAIFALISIILGGKLHKDF